MEAKGHSVRREKFPANTAKCGALFPRQALIGYLLEYCLERGTRITYYYLTDMRIDDIYNFLVDAVVGAEAGGKPAT